MTGAGSLDFHRARQKVVSLITNVIGEFRDYNGRYCHLHFNSEVIQDHSTMNMICFINIANEIFFNCVFSDNQVCSDNLINDLQMALKKYHKKAMNQQILRIDLEYSVISLDPRIGGDNASANILRLLFEGLTRFDLNGNVENAVAEKLKVLQV